MATKPRKPKSGRFPKFTWTMHLFQNWTSVSFLTILFSDTVKNIRKVLRAIPSLEQRLMDLQTDGQASLH